MKKHGLLALLALSLVSTSGQPAPVFDGLFPEGRITKSLAELIAGTSLAEGEGFRVEEIARDAHSSHHVVWIRDREIPHRHDRHDLFVVILRGHGAMRLADEERATPEGSILFIPRGTPHAFRNGSGVPAVAYAIYTPAFDGKDRISVR